MLRIRGIPSKHGHTDVWQIDPVLTRKDQEKQALITVSHSEAAGASSVVPDDPEADKLSSYFKKGCF